VLLTIDTEGDNLWARRGDRGMRNVERLPEFQFFAESLNLEPTYLVAYEVVEDEKARVVIQQLARHGNCEIGTHLHAWLTPPYYPRLDSTGAYSYLHEYPEELRAAKIETVTVALEHCVGTRPTSYRGGRWSMEVFTMRTLDRLGYRADTTVTPFVSWVRTRGAALGGPNFVAAPTTPYHPAGDNILAPGGLKILEVPTSHRPCGVIPYGLYRAVGARFGDSPRAWRSACRFFLNRLSKVVHPTPAQASVPALRWLVRRLVRENSSFLNLAFHSSELVAGGAPWVQTVEDENRVRLAIKEVVDEIQRCGLPAEGITLSVFAERYGQQ
jgi:hypothetical protein